MENQIIMNEEIMEDVIEPAVEIAESCCQVNAKRSNVWKAVGITGIIGCAVAGAVYLYIRKRKNKAKDEAVRAADAPYVIVEDDGDEEEDD
ncbi:MAG: hypothetical protein NC120_13105 [Ruminococcus sp.]|nr:hypothetical protein [Ruminococcus sp.]